MIICHKYKFIFVKTLKVAGTSVEIALSELCGPEDTITPITEEEIRDGKKFRGPQNYLRPIGSMSFRQMAGATLRRTWPSRFWNHMPATQIKQEIGQETWNDYTTISIVRNPFDRIVSRFFWANYIGQDQVDFRTFLLEKPGHLVENRKIAWIDGPAAVDVMLRYEHLSEDLSALSDRLGLPWDVGAKIGSISAKRGVRPISAQTEAMFAEFPEGIDLVRILARPEIQAFGYAIPELGAPTARTGQAAG